MRNGHDVDRAGELPLPDRAAAGQLLAENLEEYRSRPDVIVLALPRGGVPVAAVIADALGARLDLMLVRKLGLPAHRELAMGAIAAGGIRVLNDDVVRMHDVSVATIDAVASTEARELARRDQAYRAGRPWPQLRGQCVILVDDGLATGATMRAAVDAVRQQQAAEIVVAVPVAPADTVRQLAHLADRVVCPFTPEPLYAIGQWYVDFDQTSDEQVLCLLRRAWAREDAR